MARKDNKGNWIDGSGLSVPEKYVNPVDKMRDKLVTKLLKKAIKLNKDLSEFKEQCFTEFEKFKDKTHEKYGINVETQEGNKWLYDFSMDYRVSIKNAKRLDFNELLLDAKALIDECIDEWSKSSDDKIILLVKQAFNVDRKGKLDRERILSLRKLKINDKKWKKAMTLINDSLSVTGTKMYLQFFQKDDKKNFKNIPLDISVV